MSFEIRSFHPSDLYSLYRICLLTGDSGKDASEIYKDPEILGHFYAAPYAVLEPELCFVAVKNGRPVGYILGTQNSEQFAARCEAEWFPPLRQRYPFPPDSDKSPDAAIIRRIHAGQPVKPELLKYPAHLHIDLLPEAQGQGLGRKLIQVFADKLRQLHVPALHLEVGRKNENAIMFYERVRFRRVFEFEFSIAFGMIL